ncbi:MULTISPECIES: DinB family protein [unclassified Paenibacillus]|uniref:DinB family protein n=1 Tax=unclassified Paenibacillus TaxID=185978 RepID=UPI00278878B3|nr:MULTISPECIES: DinB family protein [unclassified Paenibacillus]MDQ0903252.1 putative damage-inducible protein DinB [Paenibacillus sp. V4I7]MDQ0918272.1 putative damage-inducible protein DinB [Paenibacillus sp. V4I5]
MFRTIEDFVNEWNNEAKATQRVMDTLTDASLKQQIAPDFRSLGQLGWHIATTIHEMISRTGLTFDAPEGEEHAPASAKTIADTYRSSSAGLAEAIQAQWTDAKLAESTDMYGELWPNGLTLRMLISHEIHHRGEMIVLMRQAGLRVPDIYGPTREDWLERGMQPLV